MEFRLTQDTNKVQYKVFLATRQKMLLAVVLFIAAVGILLFAALPQIQKISEIRQQLETEQVQLNKIAAKLAQLEEVRIDPDYQQRVVIDDALPSEKPLLQILNSLSRVVRETRVSIGGISLSPGQIGSGSATLAGGGPTGSLDLEITVSGTFGNVQDFLTALERMSPFTTITQLTLATPKNQAADELVRASLTMSSYYFTQTVSQTLTAPLPKVGANERATLDALAQFVPDSLPEQNRVLDGGLERFFTSDELEFGTSTSPETVPPESASSTL